MDRSGEAKLIHKIALASAMSEDNIPGDSMKDYTSIEMFSMGLFTMLCVVGIVMNIVAISAFMKFKLYNSASSLQLLSLALDDFGTALLVEPLVIFSYLKPKLFLENPWICRLFSSTLHIFPWGSTISILILSTTRLLIVMNPQIYRSYITCKHIHTALCAKYLFLVAFVGVSNFFWDTSFSLTYKQCFVSYVIGASSDVVTEDLGDKMTLPLLHILGGSVIFVINAIVIVELIKTRIKGIARYRMRHINNAGIELILLVTVYMITTVSIPGVFLTNILGVQLTADRIALMSCIAKLLFYLQPIINPIIYIIRRPEYRLPPKHANITFALRNQIRNERGKFHKTARAFINSKRFIDEIEARRKARAESQAPYEDVNELKLWLEAVRPYEKMKKIGLRTNHSV
jgi:hypothetical protein